MTLALHHTSPPVLRSMICALGYIHIYCHCPHVRRQPRRDDCFTMTIPLMTAEGLTGSREWTATASEIQGGSEACLSGVAQTRSSGAFAFIGRNSPLSLLFQLIGRIPRGCLVSIADDPVATKFSGEPGFARIHAQPRRNERWRIVVMLRSDCREAKRRGGGVARDWSATSFGQMTRGITPAGGILAANRGRRRLLLERRIRFDPRADGTDGLAIATIRLACPS